jgi:Fe-S cluster assembly protein SufD
MTIAVMKTKAETALAQQVAAAKLTGVRAEAFAAFDKVGLPSRRVEEWKYTDLRARLSEAFPLAMATGTAAATAKAPLSGIAAIEVHVVNGQFQRADAAVAGLTISALSKATGLLTAVPADPIAALALALATDGVVITVADNAVIEKPIHIVFITAIAEPSAVATRNIMRIGKNAKVTIIESHVANGDAARQVHSLTDISVGDGAEVTHIKTANSKANETNLSSWVATIGARANYRAYQFTASNGLTRNQLFVTYAGEHAKLDISGVMLGRNSDHIDTTLVVDHAVPHCESRELFKIVLDDRARGIFQGKVIVRQHAQKSEIYADDVVCGHGATCTELNEDLVFYCRSRGIPEVQARALLIESFIGEALEKLEHEGIRDTLRAVALEWLAAKPA